MKKLISILSSFSILLGSSSLAVSCNNASSRITTPVLNSKLASELIAKLNDGDFDVSFGDYYKNIDLTTAVVDEINKLLSEEYDYSKTNQLLDSLKLADYKKDTKTFDAKFKSLLDSIAENKLFSEYSETVNDSDSSPEDFTISKDFYILNPINDTTGINGILVSNGKISDDANKEFTVLKGTKIFIDDNTASDETKTWRILGENGSSATNVPTIAQLTQEYQPGKTSPFFIKSSDGKVYNITAKTALSLRFQDYFINKIEADMLDNVLTMVYNIASMWRVESNNAYIDITNPIFSMAQTWTANQSFKTNVKMVWTYTINKKDIQTAWTSLTNDTNGPINKDGTLKNGKTLDDMYSALTSLKNLDNNDGFDPYFGHSGYKGLVLSKDGTTIGTNPISGAAYESDVNNTSNLQNRGGLLTKSSDLFYYTNSTNSNNVDLVFYLPVYMIQLLGADSTNSDVNTYQISGKDGKGSKIKYKYGQYSSTDYAKQWENYSAPTLESKDIDNIVADNTKRESMIQDIEYIVAQDSTNQTNAKKIIYSAYLTASDIYYSGLYDQIGKYIESASDDE